MSTESPSGFTDVSPSRREVLDVAAKVAVFVVGVAYAVGLVIVNIDLARHGVTNVSLTRPEYVLVGSLWLAVTMIGVASAVFLRQLVGKLWRTGQRAAALLMSALGAFVLVIALTGLGEIVSGGALLRGEVSGWFAVGGVVHWGGVLGIWLMATDVSGGRDWRTVAILGYLPLVVTLSLALVLFYAVTVFPVVKREYGGGKRPRATIFMTSEGQPWARASGLPLLRDGEALSPVVVVLETDQSLYVVASAQVPSLPSMRETMRELLGPPRLPRQGSRLGAVGVDRRFVIAVAYYVEGAAEGAESPPSGTGTPAR